MKNNTFIITPKFKEVLQKYNSLSAFDGFRGKLARNLSSLLMSIPAGIDPAVISAALLESIPAWFFSGKQACISHIIAPDMGDEDLLNFADTLADAGRLSFPFQGIVRIGIPDCIWNHTTHFEQVLTILQPVFSHIIPLFIVTDWDENELSNLGSRIHAFFPVDLCHISLKDIQKNIISDYFFQSAIHISEDTMKHLMDITTDLDYHHLLGMCSGLAANALSSNDKLISSEQIDTYTRNYHEQKQRTVFRQERNIIGFR